MVVFVVVEELSVIVLALSAGFVVVVSVFSWVPLSVSSVPLVVEHTSFAARTPFHRSQRE